MKTILIIESNLDIRESCIEILQLSGYNVLAADNGKTGIQLAITCHPDLILCCIKLLEIDGYGVLDILGKKQATAHIPFVFITSKTERADFIKGMEMGAHDYLIKPFDDLALLHTVAMGIENNKHNFNSSL